MSLAAIGAVTTNKTTNSNSIIINTTEREREGDNEYEELDSIPTSIPTPTSTSNKQNKTSFLYVNIRQLNLQVYNEIIITWNIIEEEETSPCDWIGLYCNTSRNETATSSTPSNWSCLEKKQSNGAKIGHLTWPLNDIKEKLTFINDNEKYTEFRYYSSKSNRMICHSMPLQLILKTVNDIIPSTLLANTTNNNSGHLQSFQVQSNQRNPNISTNNQDNNFISFRISG
jgi:hypothetical protein